MKNKITLVRQVGDRLSETDVDLVSQMVAQMILCRARNQAESIVGQTTPHPSPIQTIVHTSIEDQK